MIEFFFLILHYCEPSFSGIKKSISSTWQKTRQPTFVVIADKNRLNGLANAHPAVSGIPSVR